MKRNSFTPIFLCSLLLLNFAGTVLGQGTTSRVTGTVLDAGTAQVYPSILYIQRPHAHDKSSTLEEK